LLAISPLHAASQAGLLSIVRQLLKHGAKLDLPDANMNTPLHCAAREGRNDVVEALLQHGATANVRDSFDRTPAHLACMSNAQIPNANGQVYSLMNLVEKGRVSVNAKDRFGQTALHLACIGGNVFTAKWLVDKGGADPMIPDGLGKTPGQYLPGGNT